MLDRWSSGWVRRPLGWMAKPLEARGLGADRVSVAGFIIGLLAMPALAMGWYKVALGIIIINRIGDGMDGLIARRNGPTDAGGFLDIVLDFIFYASVVVGFAWANPEKNALASVLLLFSFMGTGSSFLAFAVLAERRKLTSSVYPHKALYYMGGLTEGTETILFYLIVCLIPDAFPILAYLFALACGITTLARILTGYQTLSAPNTDDKKRG